VDILKGAMQPMFLVCVTDQVRRLGDLRVPSTAPRKPQRPISLDLETSTVRYGS
jgi:hypothetical protein